VSKKTKENILDSALKLFNEKGLVNVRLQHIADEAFISIGNMAYHYKNKESIVHAIHELLELELKTLMAEMNVVPLFDYVNQYFENAFQLQLKYAFFFTDMLEVFRSYPDIAEKHSKLITWQKKQYELMLEFNQNRGVFEMPEIDNQKEHVVNQLWMVTYMFQSFRLIEGAKPNLKNYCDQIWSIFIPLMTERGLQEYKQLGSFSII